MESNQSETLLSIANQIVEYCRYPTNINFGRLLKSCDIIFSIEVITCFPIISNQG